MTIGSVGPSGTHYGHNDCALTKWAANGSPALGSAMVNCTCPKEGTLRRLVHVWRIQKNKCDELFEKTLVEINRELDTVGGYATTSPDEKGYCRSLSRRDDSFGGGISTEVAHASVGDRCYSLERAWAKEAGELSLLRQEIENFIRKFTSSNDIVMVAVALVEGGE